MGIIRISIKQEALRIYNGDVIIGPNKEAMLVEIWEYLELLRSGERALMIQEGTSRTQHVELPSGNSVHLSFYRPVDSPGKYWLMDIRWPDQVN